MVPVMITYTKGNLLEADAEALVNTVNTVGVMGKGVALMFKEAFPDNFKVYERACENKEVQLGKMFVTERASLIGPKWIINFPTKGHWKYPSKLEWVERGLDDLRRIIEEYKIHSIAIPPLGSGNGGLGWKVVRQLIDDKLSTLKGTTVLVFEPIAQYQNVAKRSGLEKLTPARALIAELVRRYAIIGFECTLLEIQKLGYFLERGVDSLGLDNKFKFGFSANKFGPYSDRLAHLLDGLDGSYLHCDKRLADAGPFDVIRFDDAKKDKVSAYLTSPEAKIYRPALDVTAELIDGLESPFGMELLATVDWLVHHEGVEPNRAAVRRGMSQWPAGKKARERKLAMFDERVIDIALQTLASSPISASASDA
jgi:O-acetyl-ADP-ribose deacetylase (regulator of RNase III)